MGLGILVENVEVWSDDQNAIEAVAASIGKVMSQNWLKGTEETDTLTVTANGVDYFVRGIERECNAGSTNRKIFDEAAYQVDMENALKELRRSIRGKSCTIQHRETSLRPK
jgi:hypothetical protein